jgi:hypothetical protein
VFETIPTGDRRCPLTTQSKPYPRIGTLIDTFASWLKHRRELNEMRQMDRSDFDGIVGALRICPGELDTLIQEAPHAADELPFLLRALGIDEARLVRTAPLVLRDLQRVCTQCHHKRQCHRDLIAGTSAEHYRGYCPTGPMIDVLTGG